MAELGTDISCFPDLDPMFVLVSGKLNLAQAIARRLQTPRGGLFYDLDYGFDLRAYCNETITDFSLYALRASIEAECEKDERVLKASSIITAPLDGKLSVSIELTTAEGPFKLILAASAVTVELLKVE
jgi:phage baseplate assembly protein W